MGAYSHPAIGELNAFVCRDRADGPCILLYYLTLSSAKGNIHNLLLSNSVLSFNIVEIKRMQSDLQVLGTTCSHFEEYKSKDLKLLRKIIVKLKQQIRDLKIELSLVKALYKAWRFFAIIQ